MKTSIFKNNTTQAVRIPRDLAFPDHVKTVEIIDTGTGRLITPTGTSWDAFFDQISATDDFMENRNQPMPQERESMFSDGESER